MYNREEGFIILFRYTFHIHAYVFMYVYGSARGRRKIDEIDVNNDEIKGRIAVLCSIWKRFIKYVLCTW